MIIYIFNLNNLKYRLVFDLVIKYCDFIFMIGFNYLFAKFQTLFFRLKRFNFNLDQLKEQTINFSIAFFYGAKQSDIFDPIDKEKKFNLAEISDVKPSVLPSKEMISQFAKEKGIDYMFSNYKYAKYTIFSDEECSLLDLVHKYKLWEHILVSDVMSATFLMALLYVSVSCIIAFNLVWINCYLPTKDAGHPNYRDEPLFGVPDWVTQTSVYLPLYGYMYMLGAIPFISTKWLFGACDPFMGAYYMLIDLYIQHPGQYQILLDAFSFPAGTDPIHFFDPHHRELIRYCYDQVGNSKIIPGLSELDYNPVDNLTRRELFIKLLQLKHELKDLDYNQLYKFFTMMDQYTSKSPFAPDLKALLNWIRNKFFNN